MQRTSRFAVALAAIALLAGCQDSSSPCSDPDADGSTGGRAHLHTDFDADTHTDADTEADS